MINPLLSPFEKLSAILRVIPAPELRDDASHLRPIFICGAPRSGTTLLYQALSFASDAGYVSNLIARFAMHPPAGIYLSQSLNLEKVFTGQSHFGGTNGLTEPHEFGAFWLKVFGLTDLREPEQPTHESVHEGLEQIHALLEAFDRPVIFKSFAYLWYIQQVAAAFPASKWIHIIRDEDANARSLGALYQARAAQIEDDVPWTSAICRSTLNAIPFPTREAQCLQQVRDINAHIDRNLATLSPAQVHAIEFAQFLTDPDATLRQLGEFLGVSLNEDRLALVCDTVSAR